MALKLGRFTLEWRGLSLRSPAPDEPKAEPNSNQRRLAPVLWYIAIAAFNAALYVALGASFVALGASPPIAGVLALAPVLAVSYLGHKSKTFRSTGLHRHEAPRFLAVSAVDLVLAALVPKLGVYAHAPPVAAFLLLTALIPLVNFLLMRFWIFQEPRA